MATVIVDKKLTKEDIKVSREDYPLYIKITADLEKEIIVIGGEYHADAEKVLIEKFGSKRSDVWGGGYNIETNTFECNAILNLKPATNDSLEILDPVARKRFLQIVKMKLDNIQSLT